jgi:hypothetical protein
VAHRRTLAFLLGVALLTSSCGLVRIQGSAPSASAEASGPIPDRPACAPKPVRLVFKFDPGTIQADRDLIRDAITKARGYFPLEYPRDARWSYLDQHYVCYPKQYWEPVVTTFTPADDRRTAEYRPRRGIRIYLGSDGWRNSPPTYRTVITFHEAYHWFQDLASKNPHSISAGHEQPLWMVEGSAEWAGWDAAVHFGSFPSMDEARRLEHGALKTDRADLPKYEFRDADIFDAYPLFFTAVDELMAAHGGRRAMRAFWEFDTSESWRVFFQDAFGISVKKFYAEFARG